MVIPVFWVFIENMTVGLFCLASALSFWIIKKQILLPQLFKLYETTEKLFNLLGSR